MTGLHRIRRAGLDAVAIAAAAMQPQSFAANFRAAGVRQRRQDFAGAIRHLTRAALAEDCTRRASWELAKLLLRLDQREAPVPGGRESLRNELIRTLRESARSNDSVINEHARVALANTLYASGRCTEALSTAESLLAQNPDHVKALSVKAKCLIARKEFGDSCAVWRRILEINPGDNGAERMLRVLESLDEPASGRQPEERREPSSILVAVGSGLGDMLHVTPTIRNIARSAGRRVDVVALADHDQSQFLLQNPEYVASVRPLRLDVLEQRFESVFVTNSFGPIRFAFNGHRVIWSRDWRTFRPGGLHETIFNLEAASQLLGIPYQKTDTQGYYVGNLTYHPPAEILIGLHAGSKPGRWLSKRWPHFPELAKRLQGSGLRVASFGLTGEYVEGTENRTGGSIEAMCRAMLECSHFVSNDSGLMNIASALGIPTLALFAPTDAKTRLPLRQSTFGVTVERDCAPCEVKDHRYFASGKCTCISSIPVDRVERELMRLIANPESG